MIYLLLYEKVNVLAQHSIAHILSYNNVAPCLRSFACTMSFIFIPLSMYEEMSVLHKIQTWELTSLPPENK